jgi:hypothetical protein
MSGLRSTYLHVAVHDMMLCPDEDDTVVHSYNLIWNPNHGGGLSSEHSALGPTGVEPKTFCSER